MGLADQQAQAILDGSWPYVSGQQAQRGQRGQLRVQPPIAVEEYVNRVEVERHEHDATLTFYRDGAKAGKCIVTLTVPLALLDNLTREV